TKVLDLALSMEQTKAWLLTAGIALVIVGTVNKDGGQPVSSDDRAFLMTLNPTSGGGGKD
ncbi:hypothetical protein ACFQ1S_22800, partial [Kibdelosporangium lantanae]